MLRKTCYLIGLPSLSSSLTNSGIFQKTTTVLMTAFASALIDLMPFPPSCSDY